jgi:hypothetical protein
MTSFNVIAFWHPCLNICSILTKLKVAKNKKIRVKTYTLLNVSKGFIISSLINIPINLE